MQYCGLALVSSFRSWAAFDFGTEIEIDSIIYSFIIIYHNKICFNVINIWINIDMMKKSSFTTSPFRTSIFAKGRFKPVIDSSCIWTFYFWLDQFSRKVLPLSTDRPVSVSSTFNLSPARVCLSLKSRQLLYFWSFVLHHNHDLIFKYLRMINSANFISSKCVNKLQRDATVFLE